MFLVHLTPAKIAAAGLDDTTMVIVVPTRLMHFCHTPVAEGAVTKGEAVIELKVYCKIK